MRLTTLVYRNITRRRIRSALTVMGMAVAVAAVIALVGIADGFKRSFLEMYRAHGVDVVVVRARVADRMSSELDQSLGRRIASISHVTHADPVLLDVVTLDHLGPVGVVVQGLQLTPRIEQDRRLTAGRWMTSDARREVMLGRILAAKLAKGVGDDLEIYENERCTVVGVYDGGNIFENGAMIVPLAELQRMLDQQGLVTAFNISVDQATNKDVVNQVVAAINGLDAGLSAMATESYVATDTKIQIANAMAWSVSTIALAIGAIGMLNTMMISVFERTNEIGILRAIGWRRSRIVRLIVAESSLLCLTGGVLGTLLALAMTALLSRAPATAGLVSPSVGLPVIGQGVAIALLIGLLGALYPAFRAAQLQPTVALRQPG